MENHFPFHHFSDFQNLMSNIMAEGEEKVWQSIEEQPDALYRIQERKMYFKALEKLNKGK